MQLARARRVAPPGLPGGEEVEAEAEAGREDHERRAAGPALRRAIAGEERVPGLRRPPGGAVIHVAELLRPGRAVGGELEPGRNQRHWITLCSRTPEPPMNKPAEFNPQVKLETVPVWINGKALAPAGRHGEVFNPATGQVTKKVVFSDAALIDAAVQAAAAAFPAWRDTPVLRRARVMQKFLQLLQAQQKELAKIITEEHGKTLDDAMGSVQRGIEVVEFACGIPQLLKGEHSENVGTQVDTHTLRQPVGVCAGITPFNFPVMVPLWMFPLAIACGNTFILKPSEKVPSASIRMAELFKQAGLPDGVLNVIHGDKAAVDALLSHEGIKAVSFVGSTPVAKYIYETAAKAGKRVQALGGAKNHAVVLPDADLEFAADPLIGPAYGSAGERCMAISAVVAVGAAGDPLVKLLEKKAKQIKLGVDMGPLVTRQHRDKVASYLDIGVKEGARLVVDARKQQRSEEHTSELQSQSNLVCRLLLEKKKTNVIYTSSLSTLQE